MEIQENELIIKIPSGMEIDKENSTFECIKFKPIKKELPKTWEEFCETHPKTVDEWYLTGSSQVLKTSGGLVRNPDSDKNMLPSRELAKAVLALCQLIQLRDCYNDGWIPDWSIHTLKSCIGVYKNKVVPLTCSLNSKILVFKTAGLRDEFLNNFGDLLETTKLLL